MIERCIQVYTVPLSIYQCNFGLLFSCLKQIYRNCKSYNALLVHLYLQPYMTRDSRLAILSIVFVFLIFESSSSSRASFSPGNLTALSSATGRPR